MNSEQIINMPEFKKQVDLTPNEWRVWKRYVNSFSMRRDAAEHTGMSPQLVMRVYDLGRGNSETIAKVRSILQELKNNGR